MIFLLSWLPAFYIWEPVESGQGIYWPASGAISPPAELAAQDIKKGPIRGDDEWDGHAGALDRHGVPTLERMPFLAV